MLKEFQNQCILSSETPFALPILSKNLTGTFLTYGDWIARIYADRPIQRHTQSATHIIWCKQLPYI